MMKKETLLINEKGATLIEYVLLAALIAVVCIVGMRTLGTSASQAFSRVGSAVDSTR